MSFSNTTFKDIETIYEDSCLLIVNKPSGMLAHPTGKSAEMTLLSYCIEQQDNPELKLIHRLDRKTSGIILIAKNEKAINYYGNIFKERLIKKIYLAQLQGKLIKTKGTLDNFLNIDKNSKVKVRRKVSVTGQQAITQYKKIQHNSSSSFVLLKPLTGRTHQLRVHMAYLGHPIAGDPLYDLGDEYYLNLIQSDIVSPPMHLHAWKVCLPLMNGKTRQFKTNKPSFWPENKEK